jgi:hypothetical protein
MNNPLIYTDPSGEFFWLIPNIGWSKEGGLSIGISVVVGIPGIASAQAGIGYNLGSNDLSAYAGASAYFNTAYVAASTQSGLNVGWSAGFTPYSGLPISTNFTSVGVNYNISNNAWSGNVSSWGVDKNGWTFNPSVSVMILPEHTTNLVRGQGFRSNNSVLQRFVANGQQQDALDYFGFEGTYIDDDGTSSFWFDKKNPSDYGIRYRNGSFISYEELYSSFLKEQFHLKRYEQQRFDLGNSGVFSVDRWPEEKQGAIHQYKTRGLHNNKADFLKTIRNTEGMINRHNNWGDYNPVYQYQSYIPKWWHFIYKIPRKW